MESVDWLMLVGTVLVVSFVLARFVSRRNARGDDGSQASTGSSAFLDQRTGLNWPLVALLLLVASPVAGLTGYTVAVAACAVVAWWIAEAFACGQMPRARNPLALLATALRQLWSNRSLLIALVGLWLASATVSYLFYVQHYPEYAQHIPPPPVATGETSGSPEGQTQPPEQMSAPSAPSVMVANSVVIADWVSVLPTTLARSLPQEKNISVGYVGYYLLPIVLFVALVWLAFRPPAWLPAASRRRLFWPLNLTLAFILVNGASLLPMLFLPQNTMASAVMVQMHSAFSVLATAALSAPFVALLWHVGMQVARGERWDMRAALLGMLETWQPICIIAVAISVPTFISLIMLTPPFFGAPEWVYRLGTVLKVALALVPWIVVDQRVGLRKALRETWRFASSRAPDLLVFTLRFAVMFAAPAVLLRALQPDGLPSPSPTMIFEQLPREILTTLAALVIAGMYLELRGDEPDPRSAQTDTDGVADPLDANGEEAAHVG